MDTGTARSFCRTYPGDKAIEWECRRMGKGETLEELFGERWQDVARFNRIDRRHAHAGVYLKFPKRPDDHYTPLPRYFEPAGAEEKFILIDLSKQFLGAYERGRLVFSTLSLRGRKRIKPRRANSGSAHSTANTNRLYISSRTQILSIR